MKEGIGKFIKKKRIELGMSAMLLGEKAGISDAHVLYIEHGKRHPTFNVVKNIIRALGVSWDEFLRETGYMPSNIEPAKLKKLRPVPVISWVTAGKWQEVCDTFQAGQADEFIESDVKGQYVFALRVKGDSMEPEFHEGDIIVVNPHIDTKSGDFVIVKNQDEEATFKQLKKYGDTLVLHPLNPKYPDIEFTARSKYRIIGKVVEKKKRY